MNNTTEPKPAESGIELPRFANVLLCTDFSPASQAAAKISLKLCRGRDTHLTVMHVSEYGPIAATTDEGLDYVLGLVDKEHRSLKQTTDELLGTGLCAQPVMLEGSATSNILDYIDAHKVDLTILGTTAARGLERLLCGSTAESIFRRVSRPVLTIGPQFDFTKPEGDGPIIFATDLENTSLDALRYARALAEITGSPLQVVHVLPLTVKQDADTVSAILKEMQALVTAADGEAPHCEILGGGEISSAVVEYAKNQHASFIVLGVRRRSAVYAHLRPQRTFRMIMTAPCPVLTVAYKPQPTATGHPDSHRRDFVSTLWQ